MSSILDIQHMDTSHLHPTHPAHRRFREQMAGAPAARARHLSLVPPVAAAASGAQPALRLTRRGRLALFLSTVLMLAALAVILGSTTVATDDPGTPIPATMVTVKPGQTLWDLAAKANPTGDIQVTVNDIMKLNSMPSGSSLQAGDTIAVPLYR
jgi:hypothetical protein